MFPPDAGPTPVVAIGGTWSTRHSWDGDDQWWGNASPWWQAMTGWGFVPLRPDDPFVWSSDINGGARWPWQRESYSDWHAGARALKYYLRDVPIDRRHVVAHSHAGNVVAMACATGLVLASLVTVSTPVRADLRPYYVAAAPRVGQWLHLFSDWSDRMQWFGCWFDGSLDVVRDLRVANVNNEGVPGMGHTGVLTRPEGIARWHVRGWTEFLRAEPARITA